jgi:hypothetical protein
VVTDLMVVAIGKILFLSIGLKTALGWADVRVYECTNLWEVDPITKVL